MQHSEVAAQIEVNQTEHMAAGRRERYLCFNLGPETYAMPLLSVKEVIAPPEITPVPQTPNYFLGIMNLRGQVISVIDLRIKLSIKPTQAAETAIIICDMKPNSMGVVVDSINSVLNPKPEDMSGKPQIQSTKTTEYILGVFRHAEKLVLMIDIAKTLSMGDLQLIAAAPKNASK
jgi:purine-binding chemotaxis protein CheW